MVIEDSTPATLEYLDFTVGDGHASTRRAPTRPSCYVCPQASAPCDDDASGSPAGPEPRPGRGPRPAGHRAGRARSSACGSCSPPPDGGSIENRANGGTAAVDIDMALRDTVRSTGAADHRDPADDDHRQLATTTVDDDPGADPSTGQRTRPTRSTRSCRRR